MVDWSSAPAQPGPARDAWILDAIRAGEAEYEFAEVPIEGNGHTGTVLIFRDALKLGGVRINVSADLQQQIADLLDCVLLTPQLADRLFAARAWTVPPKTSAPDNQMASTARMIAHSQAIDTALAAQGYDGAGIVQTVGKHWCLIKNLPAGRACNYGWHFLSGPGTGYAPATSYTGPGVRVWQGIGTVHNPQHVDYSQVCVLASRWCKIDGQDIDLGSVMMDPEFAAMVTSDGPLPSDRQPSAGQPQQPVVDHAPPVVVTTQPRPAPARSSSNKVARVVVGALGLAALFFGARAIAR